MKLNEIMQNFNESEFLKWPEDKQNKFLSLCQDIKAFESSINNKFYELFYDKSRYLVLVGGGGSGKSIFAGRKILERVQTERGHKILVVRKVGKTLRESCFAQLKGQISDNYNYSDWTINKTDMAIRHRNGNEIIFSGLDDVEKLKSIYNVTSVWIEEASEIDESDLNQLDIRLRGKTNYYKQIIISFNPIDVNHWLKKRFFDNKVEGAKTHHSTYKDNEFLDDEAKKVLESYKDTDPYYYQVYCLGQWGTYGKTIFDSLKVNQRIDKIKDIVPVRGYFAYETNEAEKIIDKSIRFIESVDGFVAIYEHPKYGYPYVIGGDTAGEGSDNFIGQVIDNTTGNQVCTLSSQFDEDLYAKQMYCLGRYYNNALIGIESNFSTYPIMELQRMAYPFMYMREQEDSITHKIEHKYGFKTTSLTRPIIIANLVQIVRESSDCLNDYQTLNEMLTFVRNEKGRPEAQQGAHDDTIIALAITYYIRDQQHYTVQEESKEVKPRLKDTLIKPKKEARY